PAQFSTHCVENWPSEVKRLHIPQVRGIESPAVVPAQAGRQLLNEALAVVCASSAALFLLNNDLSKGPVGANHDGVDGSPSLLSGPIEEGTNLRVKPVKADVRGGRAAGESAR